MKCYWCKRNFKTQKGLEEHNCKAITVHSFEVLPTKEGEQK